LQRVQQHLISQPHQFQKIDSGHTGLANIIRRKPGYRTDY
jgi:hypothetical protein